MNRVGETDLIAAQKKIMGVVQKVSEDMAQFIMALEVVLWKQHFGNEIIAERIAQISNAPNLLEHWHPFYIDLTEVPSTD